MIRSLVALAFLPIAISSQPDKPGPAKAFRDDKLHFTFNYPDGYINRVTPASMAAARDAARSSPDGAQMADCTQIPVAAVHPADGLFDMVLLVELDLACSKEQITDADLAGFTSGVAKKILSAHGAAKLGSPLIFDLAGHKAIYLPESVDESAKSPGRVLAANSVCTLIEKSAVCWVIMSYKPETLRNLSELLVTFDGKPVSPLVPSSILDK